MAEVIRFRGNRPVGAGLRVLTGAELVEDGRRKGFLVEARKLGGDAAVRAFAPLPTALLTRAVVDLSIQKTEARRAPTGGTKTMATTPTQFGPETTALLRDADLPEAVKKWIASLDDATAKKILRAVRPADGRAPAPAGLTEREIAKCRSRGINPTRYAEIKAAAKGGK